MNNICMYMCIYIYIYIYTYNVRSLMPLLEVPVALLVQRSLPNTASICFMRCL